MPKGWFSRAILFSAEAGWLPFNFLYYGKLRGIDLAVLHCLDTRKTTIGEQFRVGVARFFAGQQHLLFDRNGAINFCLSGVCAQMSEQFVGTGVLDCPHKNEKFDQNHVDCL